MRVERVSSQVASAVVVANHYLHRRPPISFAFGLMVDDILVGVVTFGAPASHAVQVGACRTNPGLVIELNRLWVHDSQPRNTESWFIAQALALLPPRIVVSYADTTWGHLGYVYRASNFKYAGWTDMDRKTPRCDYIPAGGGHGRNAFRKAEGWVAKVRRKPKVKYWITTGNKGQRKAMGKLCTWADLNWKTQPPPALPEIFS